MFELDLMPTTNIRRESTKRLSEYVRETIPSSRREEYETQGWVLDKVLKSSLRMRRVKRHDVAFEDRVWAMCARLGFQNLNKGRKFTLQYGQSENERKQIDVLAADDDVVLVIECKSSLAEQAPTHAFKTEIESIQGYREGLIRTLRACFPEHKVKFILATNNINVSDETIERIESASIAYIDEETVNYYLELSEHLGPAAKFQLLGNLFSGTQIPAMDPLVPAIRGKMGGYTYYSFAIEPDRLLKISYVLHRNNANMRWMPTYQRIIKKARLKKVSSFVDNGGFFPNSLVINIDTNGKRLRFDRAPMQSGNGALGVLHLPRKYRSAYIIDGQHRLYGFAESERASSELIPVVAFIDLPPEEQVSLFMQINENQQSVPKNLRNTLNADLLWTSDNLNEQARALKLKISQALGEQKSSPLRGRVIIGEEKATDRRCIGLDSISRGIDRAGFIGNFTATEMKHPGSFYRGSNDATLKPIVKYLELCFEHLRDELPTQWNIGRGVGGFVFTNVGVEALIRLLGDLVNFCVDQRKVDARRNSPDDIFAHTRTLLQPLISYIGELNLEESTEFKSMYGSGAATIYWRRFQIAVSAKFPDFCPEGLKEWQANQVKQFNSESFTMIRDIESYLKQDIRRRLEDKHGASWFKIGVPQAVYQEAATLAAKKQWQVGDDEEIDWWDCLFLSDYHKILLHGNQSVWQELFDETYTLPSERKASSWKSKSSWMDRLVKIRNTISHDGSATEQDYEFLSALHSHLGLGALNHREP